MHYRIFPGFDHLNQRDLWHVTGTDNDFVGDWHRFKDDADNELAALLEHDGNLREAESHTEALAALEDGRHVFCVHEMAEDEPRIVTDPAIIRNFSPDSILIETQH